MVVTHPVSKYTVIHYSWSSTKYFRVLILLYDQNAKRIGDLRFFNELHSPLDEYDSDNDRIIAHYPLSRYPEIIDFLRNEGGLSLAFNTATNEARLYSGKEPVGEGED